MELCPFCGTENRPHARFCHACGRELPTERPPHPPASSSETGTPNAPTEPLAPEPSVPPPPEPLVSPTAVTVPEELETQALATPSQVPPSALPTPLARFRLLHLLSEETEGRVYEAEDLLTCWNCHHLQTEAGMNFCEECGAALEQKVHVRLQEKAALDWPPSDENHIVIEGQGYEILTPVAPSPASSPPPEFHWHLGYRTDPGRQREINEDSLLVLQLTGISEMQVAPALGFFAIADGIGGHEAGEVASRTAIRTLAAAVMRDLFLPDLATPLPEETLSAALTQAIQAANDAILALRHTHGETDMGCTLTAVLLRNAWALVANVGDSRTYLMRDSILKQITQDHSVVANLVAAGIIQPEEQQSHAQHGVIYRSLGDKPQVEIDLFPIPLHPGDRLLLCCDGLSEMVAEDLIEEVLLARFDPQAACDRLVENANHAGGEDNISVIVLNIQTL